MEVFITVASGSTGWPGEEQLPSSWKKWQGGTAAGKGLIRMLLFFAVSSEDGLAFAQERKIPADESWRCVFVSREVVPAKKNLGLLAAGFSDVICWTGAGELIAYVDEKFRRWKHIDEVLNSSLVAGNLIGSSKTWKHFLCSVIEAAEFSASNILILGQSGTGKELLSRLVHTLDRRAHKTKLVLLDCSTISPELSGSEFFGHEKGAYTGAAITREGAFSLANRGTLFLDEIGELPLRMQSELLRVIQEGNFKKVGSNAWQNTSFRLVSATNRDLKEMIEEKTFRGDLYYRISDVVLQVPSLDDRREDVRPLAKFFLREFYADQYPQTDVPDFDESVLQLLECRSYSGNVRELRQIVRRIAMRHTGAGVISMGDVPPQDRPVEEEHSLSRKFGELEEFIRRAVLHGDHLCDIKNLAAFTAIKAALELESGNRQKAAERLNITTRAIQQYFKKNEGEVTALN